ncbi:MAG: hypothetical protein LBP59_11945 [Planctomycetaceae bacterium]|jgi:hypothetical protein|nr:hypothetical protein [Planctomycetaceae bacterium]
MLMKMLMKMIIFLGLFVILPSSILIAEEVSDLKKHITENSQEIWKKYLSNFKNGVDGNIKIATFKNDKMTNNYTSYVLRQKNWSLQEIDDPQKKTKIVNSYSQNYFFRVQHPASAKQWTVDLIEKNSQDELNDIGNYEFPSGKEKSIQDLKDFVFRFYILRCLALDPNVLLPTLARLPEFNIEQVKEIQKDGVNYYAVDYTFTPSGAIDEELIIKNLGNNKTADISDLPEGLQKYPMIDVRNGKLLLTTDYLLIKEADVEILGVGKCKIICDYRYEKDIPLISAYTMTYTDTEYKSVHNFDLKLNPAQNAKRFTLSNYGLTEPDFDNLRSTSWVNYFFQLLGVIVILIAIKRIILTLRSKV